ncbi:MAG TPA: hypothetical protein VE465_28255 [Streptosporangiaceae bacterium]|nr:hypothetical protein [Streptosporangiaceae bacterium]
MGAVHSAVGDVADHLAELGLSVDMVHRVLARAEAAARSCTPNHPVNAEGWFRWANSVCYLREELSPAGWTRARSLNFELVVQPGGMVAIAVTAGDEATGCPDVQPRTGNPKGAMTVAAVVANVGPQTLFEVDEFRRRTWFLLYYRDEHEIRAELALPDNVSPGGYIDSWSERIVIPPYPLDGRLPAGPQSALPIDGADAADGADGADGISVPVRRRGR